MKKILFLTLFCVSFSFSQYQYGVRDASLDSTWFMFEEIAPTAYGNVTWLFNDPNYTSRDEEGAVYAIEFQGKVTSSQNTVTTLATYTVIEQKMCKIKVSILGVQWGGTAEGCSYDIIGLFNRELGGSTSQVGTTVNLLSIESNVLYDAAFDISGNDVRVRVTGLTLTDTFWSAFVRVEEIDGRLIE